MGLASQAVAVGGSEEQEDSPQIHLEALVVMISSEDFGYPTVTIRNFCIAREIWDGMDGIKRG